MKCNIISSYMEYDKNLIQGIVYTTFITYLSNWIERNELLFYKIFIIIELKRLKLRFKSYLFRIIISIFYNNSNFIKKPGWNNKIISHDAYLASYVIQNSIDTKEWKKKKIQED